MNIDIIILAILIIVFLLQHNKDRSRRLFVIFSCFLFTIQSGFRSIEVGNDTSSYYLSFYEILSTPWSEIIGALFMDSAEVRDPGFSVVVKFFGTLFPHWQLFCIASALFFYVSLGKLWYKYIESRQGVLFASILWLTLFDIIALSGMRQMLTTAIAFYMIPYVEAKRWWIVLPVIGLGSLIHISLLFFLAFLPLSYIPISQYKKMLCVSILLVPVVGLFAQQIMTFMVNRMDNEYYQTYAEVAEGNKAYTYVVICTMLSFFVLLKYRTDRNQA